MPSRRGTPVPIERKEKMKMGKSTKKFFITQTARCYDGSIRYTPKCWKRFATREEAEAVAEEMNRINSWEKREAMYRGWIEDPATEWATDEWYELHMKSGRDSFYCTYEAKESK
jgi:hypothetical protein